jgi:hypothetical protein
MSFTEHLLHWKGNKDSLDDFADRIAELKDDLVGHLSQQPGQCPWEHADALERIESRLVINREFYANVCDEHEEIAESFLEENGGEEVVQMVSSNFLSVSSLMDAGSRMIACSRNWLASWERTSPVVTMITIVTATTTATMMPAADAEIATMMI